MSSEPVDVAATPLKLAFATGRRGGTVGAETPLPALLLELAGTEERKQHEQLTKSRRETADELHRVEGELDSIRAGDKQATRQALKRGTAKMPEPKAPATELAIAGLKERLNAYDELLVESAQELLDSVPEPRVAAAWAQAREDELAVLAALPNRVREVVAELDRAAGLRAQRGWLTGLLSERAAGPFGVSHAGRGRDEQQTRGDLQTAASRLEAIAAGVEQAGLVIDEGAQWQMDPRYHDRKAAKEA